MKFDDSTNHAPLEMPDDVNQADVLFHSLANATPVMMWLSDADKHRYYFNPAWLEFTGRTLEEERGDGWTQGVHTEDLPAFVETYARAFEAREKSQIEYRLRRHDGEYRWVIGSGAPYYRDGAFAGYLGTTQDVTQRKQAEQSLIERERLAMLSSDVSLALIQNKTLPEILHACAEAVVKHLDAAFARIWTLGKEDVLELQASAGIYTHLDGAHSRVPVGKFKIGLIAAERKPHLTNSVIGDARVSNQEWAEREGMVAFVGYPLIVGERLVGVVAMFARQTLGLNALKAMESAANIIALGIERRQAEQALRESEEHYRVVAEAASDAVITIDETSTIHYVNAATERMFGYEVAALMNQKLTMLMPAEFHARHRGGIKRYVATGQRHIPWEAVPATGLHKDGHEFSIEISFGEFIKDDKHFFTGIVRDITERKRAEEALAAYARDRELMLEEVSTPVVPIWQGVLLIPLVGSLDTKRMQQATRAALDQTMRTNARYCIIDITATRIVDTQAVANLSNLVVSLKLVGCDAVVTGVTAQTARVLVQLGLDLTQMRTQRTLAEALASIIKTQSSIQSQQYLQQGTGFNFDGTSTNTR